MHVAQLKNFRPKSKAVSIGLKLTESYGLALA